MSMGSPEATGFVARLELRDTRTPIWRRVELPGDLTLPELHEVIQAAMGWTDSHLHRFRTGSSYRSASFVTRFDIDEGEDGTLEDDVRLDQLVTSPGDGLWYEYDFGDGWDHELLVETTLDARPSQARCVDGRGACPPEDCGGVGGYDELAAWVRSGHDGALLPDAFDDAEQARTWLPSGWHPDRLDLDEVAAALEAATARPVAVTGRLVELSDELGRRGVTSLREVLSRPAAHGPSGVTDGEAARLTQTYRDLLESIGDGVRLTSAGYLPPAVVESFAQRSGITEWWIGKANREDLTPPVRHVRDTARALGLVNVRSGRLGPTAAAKRCSGDPRALWEHVVARLPLGSTDFDRDAGWLALAVAASGAEPQAWRAEVSALLFAAGWRLGGDTSSPPPAHSPTLTVLEGLAGAARTGWRVVGADEGVARTARAAIGRP